MKILKYLFFLILIVLIGGAIYFAAQDGSYQIEETKIIDAPKAVVFNKVNEYKTWEEWGPWKEEDPTMVFNYADDTSGEGASYSWNGEMDGSMRTTKVIPNSEIQQELTIKTPMGERESDVYWRFEDAENGSATKVTWGVKGEHPLVDKAYFSLSGLDFNSDMRTMYDEGLDGLAQSVKKEISAYNINVDGITAHSGGYYLYRTTSATAGNISQIMDHQYGAIMNFMQQNNIQQSGMPFTIYLSMNDVNGDVIMSNAIPVNERIIVPKDSQVLCDFQPESKVLKTTLKGNYTHLGEAWSQAMAYIEANDLEQNNLNPFEVYSTDPEKVPNPADWVTEIYIPIR